MNGFATTLRVADARPAKLARATMRTLTLGLLMGAVAMNVAIADEFACPPGASALGESPPQGFRRWCELADGIQHGASTTWYRDGKRKAQAYFDHGKLTGEYKLWHENGQVAEQSYYIDDSRDGESSVWAADGTLRGKREYIGGGLHGTVTGWHPNGKLQLIEHYVDGVRHGLAVAYFDNGQKESEGEFRNGRFHGKWEGWYPNGSMRKVAEFVEGKPISVEEFDNQRAADD